MIKWQNVSSKLFSSAGRRALVLGVLTGIFAGTTFIPFPPWAVFFIYVPLLISFFEETSLRRHFMAGWWAQFTLTLIGFHWIAFTAKEFGQMPWPVAILVLLSFAGLMHLHIPVAMAVAGWLRTKLRLSPATGLITILMCFILAERFWPMIFKFHFGYTFLWAKLPIYHWADVIGFTGLSGLIFLGNGLFYLMWRDRKNLRQVSILAFIFILIFGGLNYTGSFRGQNLPVPDTSVQFLAVQANIGNLERIYAEKGRGYQNEITQRYIKETETGLSKFPTAQVVVWPESAFPDFLDAPYLDNPRQIAIRDMIRKFNLPFIIGSFSKEKSLGEIDRAIFNALFSFDAQGAMLQGYRKSQLLAFGEYLPFSETFPILNKLVPFVSSFGRGPGAQVVPLPVNGQNYRFGPQICYEGLEPAFSRTLANLGSQVMINVTNDSWFGHTFEPSQHLYMTLARGVENRLPLLRVTNTGITTAILANGTVLQKSPIDEVWSGVYDISFSSNPKPTFYARFGDWDQWIYLAILLIVIFQGVWNVRTRQR